MREVITKVYEYAELSDEAKRVARNWWREADISESWWQFIYDDAEQIGLEIKEFDLASGKISIETSLSITDVADKILANHGETCGTHKAALAWKVCVAKAKLLEDEPEDEEDRFFIMGRNEFWAAMRREYIEMLRKEYEHHNSDEYAEECILANEYEFTIEGKLYQGTL